MANLPPRVVTGQQIGVGWTPALSVIKALAALITARQLQGEAIYWMADEDHDRLEVSQCVSLQGPRILRHRFTFDAPPGTVCGFLPWTPEHQTKAEDLWGKLPSPVQPTLKGHVQGLAGPLVHEGLQLYSPLEARQQPQTPQEENLQAQLEAWRSLGLERDLLTRARELQESGENLPLDPETQHAWFAIHTQTGLRSPLKAPEKCPKDHWLSPGAALRPLMQSYLLDPTHVVLGPAERRYWKLADPLWEKLGLIKPRIIARPSVYLLPSQVQLQANQLEALRLGQWQAWEDTSADRPSLCVKTESSPAWDPDLTLRFDQAFQAFQKRLEKLDRRLLRNQVAKKLGMDPEKLRQTLFPLDKPQERVLPGIYWLQPAIFNQVLKGMEANWNPLSLPEDQHAVLLLTHEVFDA